MKLPCILLLCLLSVGIANAGPPDMDPRAKETPVDTFTGPIRLFQMTLSAADGNRCPMTPSCSAYALESKKRHGVLMGWIMTCDRLLRCGRDEVRHCPVNRTPNGARCADPVENNDFWWSAD